MELRYSNSKATTTAYGKGIIYNKPRRIERLLPNGEIRTTVFVDVIVAGKNMPNQERLKVLTRLQFSGKSAEKLNDLTENSVITWVGLPYLSNSRNEATLTNYKILTFDITTFSISNPITNEQEYNVVFDSTFTKIQTVVRLLENPIELNNNTCLRTCFNVQNSEKGIFLDIFTGDKINNIFAYNDFQHIKKGAKIYLTFKPFATSNFSEKTKETYVETKGEMLNYFLVEPPMEFPRYENNLADYQTNDNKKYVPKVEVDSTEAEQVAVMFNFE
ncbi:hypothetical protein ACX1NA_03390 [Mycoplasma sp. VS276A1]